MPEQQLVEIARALGAEARILIMDEPTASLSDQEVEDLFRVIGELKARGVGIIYISHRLEELPRIADRVTALRDGALVGTRRMAEVSRAELIRMMVGRELSAVFPKVAAEPGDVVLEVRGLGCRSIEAFGAWTTWKACRRERSWVWRELVGAGGGPSWREVCWLRPAARRERRASLWLRSRASRWRSARRVRPPIAMRIAYACPKDRRRHGVILEMSTAANVHDGHAPRPTRGSGCSTSARSAPAASFDPPAISDGRPRRSRPRSATSRERQPAEGRHWRRWLAGRAEAADPRRTHAGRGRRRQGEIHRPSCPSWPAR